MNEIDTSASTRRHGRSKRLPKPDYRQKLGNTPIPSDRHLAGETARATPSYADQVRMLARRTADDTVAFQSVVVAALMALHRIICCERQAEQAAISLAQQEKLQGMIEAGEATRTALRETLSAQGAKMLELTGSCTVQEGNEQSWWFALTETLQTLEESIHLIRSLVIGQPRGGTLRALSSIIIRLLRRHYRELHTEAERWMAYG